MSWAPDGVVRDGQPGMGMRIGVVGAAHWHMERHVRYLTEAGATLLEAVESVEEVARAKPDAVLLLGRVSEMAERAKQLIVEGMPVLAEKPLGLTPAEVEEVVTLAEKRRAWISVALVQRYDPIWRVLDELSDENVLGNVAYAHVRIVNGPPQRYAAWGSAWMLEPKSAGGGALLNLGIHGMDYMRHLAGERLRVVGAAVGNRAHGLGIEDFGAVTLQGESGFVGTVEAGYTYPDAAAGMTRSGDNETRVAAQGAYVIGRDAEMVLVTGSGERPVEGGRSGDRYRDWAFDSLARRRAEKEPVASVSDCLEAVRLVFAAYAAASQGDAALPRTP